MDFTITCIAVSHIERAWEDTDDLFVTLREVNIDKLINDLCDYYGDKDCLMDHINKMKI